MKKTDSKEFAQIMTLLNETFGDPSKEISPAKMDFYFKALEDLNIKEMSEAVMRLANTKTMHIFPTPAEIREAIKPREDPYLAAEQAFQSMQAVKDYYRTVVFEDGIIGRCIEALGGWNVILDWKEEDRKWNLKNFTDLYKRYYERGEALEPVTYIGSHEDHNIRIGRIEFVPERVFVPALPAVRKLRGFIALEPEKAKLPPHKLALVS